MENFYLQAVVDHLRPRLVGAPLGRVWQPDDTTLVLDLRADDGRLLLVSAAPQNPSLYLTSRGHNDFEGGGGAERSFAALVRKRLRGGRLESVDKVERDRVVAFAFSTYDAGGSIASYRLVAELTG